MRTVLTIIILSAAAALIIWVARPIWDEVLVLKAEQAATADVLGRLNEIQSLRDEIMATYNSIPGSKLDRLNNFLPQKPDSGSVLVMLENLTRDRGMRLRRVEFAKTEPQPQTTPGQTAAKIVRPEETKFSAISYAFTVSASYEAFRSFVAALEKSLRVVDVTDISFSGGQSNLFEFTLKARSYYQK
ncbi:hypothetical protein A2926_00490 [Candidatus Giovannonibacteria bacterium RIFCSPLOWO2_01_FULL_44_40]|uniref:Pilus assembly protein PilO n=1 Tax=Candidatus Giovannonibacteria bacterium RIFCSPHIGHO2_01_FULL_45_23 TaxID=1798325 RepID=A0A1F5VEV3_9BACT|nr:MAG: hypothetical protein A2834_00505 [Candidatus Giovannonibacteria bacterium RIFCSPHIGHO2_01_FULL_45_23]OGF76522.1 MAG: hypothetical protein A3C77_03210 [Candidatus Giovannonibacteria bacterium RIFCSPHIGHO2_02_FULL_45_13]OGF79789.1 MAG: hypothetical protein A2926_00490 [Candidatus Giovannonibacteria bacterium RIFCSPLOWO2_01_FULL_44_40]